MRCVTEDELNELYDWAAEADTEGSHYPGMSYEDGIKAVILWITNGDDRPEVVK